MQGTDPSTIPASKLSVSSDILNTWYNDRLTDEEIRQQMQDNNYDGSLEDFKIAVRTGKGSTVHCIEPDTTNTVNGYGTPPYSLSLESNANWTGCDPTGMFGPKNLSMQEIAEWSSQQSIPEIEQVEGNTWI